jgi:hypothetical protein
VGPKSFGEIVPLTTGEGEMDFEAVEETAAFSTDSKGLGGAKADIEAANGLGEAAGVISFSDASAAFGKVNGDVFAGMPRFSVA